MSVHHPDHHLNRSALLVTGTVGIGKTTVAEHIGNRLTEVGVPHAVIDLDRLHHVWPAPEGDRFNMTLALRNLAAVTANFLEAGARKIVAASIAENDVELALYRDALPIPLAVGLLRASLPVVHERLHRCHVDNPAGLRWHLARAGKLDRILTSAGIEDFVEESTNRPARDVAASIVTRLGWLPARQ